MIDITLLRQNPTVFQEGASRKGVKVNIDEILKLDTQLRKLRHNIETIRAKRNDLSGQVQKNAEKKDDIVTRAKALKIDLRDFEKKLQTTQARIKELLYLVPNPPADDVPEGKDENDNKVLKKEGKISPQKGKDHVDLGKDLDIIDTERGAKVSGARFYYLKNQAVELEFALIKFALDIAKIEGFQPVIPPILIKEDVAWGSGHFEAINDDAYHTTQDNMVVVGTSEQSILPMHADEILENLPKRYVGFSTCLRRETGSYGKDVGGILRVHQFEKLELFSFCKPEESKREHELIISLEENIISKLGLPYRLVKLCSGELGLPSAKTVDVEMWIPSQGRYRETHSSSNCTDFQARRLNIRYKSETGNKLVHTLNGTAIAIPRVIIAILENYQQSDGSVLVPEALRPYTGFEKISKA